MASVDYFLKLDGIEGESTDAKHKGELEPESFGWGVSLAASPGRGGGGGAGKPQFQDLTFVKRTDKASPMLFLTCATGKHVKTAVLTARKAGEEQLEYLTVRLGDVLVSSFQVTAVGDEPPLETVTLAYAKLEIVYRPQTATGAAGPEVKAGFDVKRGKQL